MTGCDHRWHGAIRSAVGLLLALALVASSTGCSVVQAMRQPTKKDLSVLAEGTERTHVVAELGSPVWTDKREDGSMTDVFTFKQGFRKEVKAGRALLHGAADVLTLGLWEVVGTPAEMMIDGKDVKVAVTYHEDESVSKVEVIQGAEVFESKPLFSLARWRRRRAEAGSSDVEAIAAGDEPPEAEAERSQVELTGYDESYEPDISLGSEFERADDDAP